MSEGKKGLPVWAWALILGPMLVFVIGIGAALVIFGVRKYIIGAKQAEAQSALTSWGDGLVRCAQRDGGLPPSTVAVPASLSAVRGHKYQADAGEWSQLAHTCAGYKMIGPQYYQYSWSLTSPDRGLLDASADLDGDGGVDSQLQLWIECAGGKCSRGAPVVLARDSIVPATGAAPGAPASSGAVTLPPLPPQGPLPTFDGSMVDVSSVMGRARKLANEWEPDATLLGVEATVQSGKVQPRLGGSAKVTFGPSRFASSATRTGLFVVTYDQSGIHGAPQPGKPSVTLPEPMCSPEAALLRVAELGTVPLTLRYGLDSVERPSWLINPVSDATQLRSFEPQECAPRGTIIVRPRR